MQQSILTINAGSSSVKFALFELAEHISEKAAISGQIDGIGTAHVRLVAKDGPYAQLRLPSGEIRNVDARCRATIGEVGNAEQSNINWGKAGRMRWKGKRPTVRGVVMNPVDHPMGGGEGRASGGHPRSRKGLLAKGYKTRNPKKTTSKFIISRKKK